MENRRYVIVDLETTGGRAGVDRIIEIGIVVHDGFRTLETFSTFVNPERQIPEFISNLTGITDDDVCQAPRFLDIAPRLLELMGENDVFVAHNVGFDYGFLKKEFAALGFEFLRKTLCTVRLTRKHFPGLTSYSLDNLRGSFLKDSYFPAHRALADAQASSELFERVYAKHRETRDCALECDDAVRLPISFSDRSYDALPELAGVSYLRDADGKLLLVLKGKNIKNALGTFFNTKRKAKKVEELREKVASVEFEVTGSYVIASILEAEIVEREIPPYNKRPKAKKDVNLIGSDAGQYLILDKGRAPKERSVIVFSPSRYSVGFRYFDDLTSSDFSDYFELASTVKLREFPKNFAKQISEAFNRQNMRPLILESVDV